MRRASVVESLTVFMMAVLTVVVVAGCGQANLPAEEETAPAPKAAPAAESAPAYPLQTCVVSGEKLGAMGDPVDYMHEGRLVRFCCKGCIGKFKADPQTYLKKLDEAAKAAAAPQGEQGAVKEQPAAAGSCCKKAPSGGGGCCK